MLDFAPTEEQEEIRKLAQSLALDHLRPHARRAEAEQDSSTELRLTLAQTGLTSPFPEEYGGSGPLEAVTYTLIAEELAYGDPGLALNIIGSLMGPLTVWLAGSHEQQQQYLPPFCNPTSGYLQRGSLAFAESTGTYRLADIRLQARRTSEGYLLTGTKRDVVHGQRADLRVVLARLVENENENEDKVAEGKLCAFVLPSPLEGLSIQAEAEKLGLQAAPSARYRFTQAQVPASALLGEAGSSGVVRAATLYQILRAALACGTARAAFEYCSAYARERIAFGRPIVSYQGIAFMIAEMAMKLDAARLLTWRAACSWDRGEADETLIREAESAQRQAIKMAQAATTDAIQVMGGAGFMQDHPAEMWMRDAAAME
ncbi:acyl-CoA dehydrogenase family protein [Thermogemmatispora sp.]|uniref:acyl-CoA dehydrogenase family protein n=1 Tax=Thermogemmatispora sp. TaxID=1968838 RepID=UPI001DD66BBC|nr:acyl-CoA dehydrogenase family protein [Thermogemmatispora sp.]MBX5449041.1 acyl-CoA dehydrogenase family protein [Thermogemmatispora sp.]